MSNVQVQRPEFVREGGTSAFGVVEKPLTLWEKTYNNASFRKGILLLPLALIWFGLGWFIYENKNLPEIANVFAGLFSVIIIGLVVENFIFRNIELKTVRKWGMQS